MTLDPLLSQRYLRIHAQLHDDQCKAVQIGKTHYPVEIGRGGCRMIRYENSIFIQQDPRGTGTLASRVRTGQTVTRILRSGAPWGLIIDDIIEVP